MPCDLVNPSEVINEARYFRIYPVLYYEFNLTPNDYQPSGHINVANVSFATIGF